MIYSEDKPEPGLCAAKEYPQPGGVKMEFASLPEKFKQPGRVKKNLCIVAPAKPASKTKGGILLPEIANKVADYACKIGRIEAVGPRFYVGKDGKPLAEAPKVGDIVMFDAFVGERFLLGGEKFLKIADENINLDGIEESDDFTLFTD